MDLWVAKDRTWSNHWDDPNSEYCWFFGIRMRTACLVIILYTHNTLCIYIYIVINMCVYIYIYVYTYMYPLKISIPVASQSLWFSNALQLTRAPWPSGSFSSNCWIWGGGHGKPHWFWWKKCRTPYNFIIFPWEYIYIYISSRISTWLSYFFPDINIYIYIYQPLNGLSGKMLLALLNA